MAFIEDGRSPDGISSDRYTVRTTLYLPDAPVVVFPSLSALPTSSTILRIEPRGRPAWYGDLRSNVVGGGIFWETRDPDCFCALFGESLYWADARDPDSVVVHDVALIVDERFTFVRSHDLFLNIGSSDIVAVGRHGVRWVTDGVAFDDIVDVVVDGDQLRGFADVDGPITERLPFTVDLATGKHEGGFPGFDLRPIE